MNDFLRQTVVDYLELVRGLGGKDMMLGASTVQALRNLKNAPRGGNERPTMAPAPALRRASPAAAAGEAPAAVSTQPPAEWGPVLPLEEKKAALERLREQLAEAHRQGSLATFKNNLVFGVGSPSASILFVGEAPGAEEDLKGEPFVGPAGQLLTKMIGAMGLGREDVYIANVVKFRPEMPPGSMGNRKPTLQEMQLCLPYLREQVGIIRPQVLVALGATALEGLLGLAKITLGHYRGRWQDFHGIPVMPTFHPSYLLRNPSLGERRKCWEDLMQVMEKTGLPLTEKQRQYFRSAGG
jgi:DNA polymerase